MTSRTNFAILLDILSKEPNAALDKTSKLDTRLAALGIENFETLEFLETDDLISGGFTAVTARAIMVTAKEVNDSNDKVDLSNMNDKADWLRWCMAKKTQREEEAAEEEENTRLIESYDRGVKRDISAYDVIKDKTLWRAWFEKSKATAISQGVGEPFDPAYKTTTVAESTIFEKKNAFVYNMLQKTIQFVIGRNILIKYQSDTDAQQVLTEINKKLTEGLSGQLDETTAKKAIEDLRLTEGYNKPFMTFFASFDKCLLELDGIRAANKKALSTDEDKELWLRASLLEHPGMYNVIQEYDQINNQLKLSNVPAKTGFEPLYEFLTQHAVKLDADFKAKNASRRRTSVNSSNSNGNKTSKERYLEEKNELRKKCRVPPTEWKAMTKEQQEQRIKQNKEQLNVLRKKYNLNGIRTGNSTAGAVAPTEESRIIASITELVKKLDEQSSSTRFVAAATQSSPADNTTTAGLATPATAAAHSTDPGEFMRHILSQHQQARASMDSRKSFSVNFTTDSDGKAWYSVSAGERPMYRISQAQADALTLALVDGGANGSLGGDDVRVLSYHPNRTIDVDGICNSSFSQFKSATVGGRTDTQMGPVIAVITHVAMYGKGTSIISKGQMEHFGIEVDDKSRKLGGQQRLVTPDGYVIPLVMRNGLPRLSLTKPTDEELANLPHVYLTQDSDEWDPTVLDNDYEAKDLEDVEAGTYLDPGVDNNVDEYGYVNYEARNVEVDRCIEIARMVHSVVPDVTLATEYRLLSAQVPRYYSKYDTKPSDPDFKVLRPNFLFVPDDRIRDTLAQTTQYYRASTRLPMRRHYRARFPGANVRRLAEDFCMDTLFADVPALDDGVMGHGGATMFQVLTGRTSEFVDGGPMKSEKQIHHVVQDFIRTNGAPRRLISDRAKSETGKAVLQILRHYCVGSWFSEPYHQWQNKAENKIGTLKSMMSVAMDRFGIPANLWLLVLLYIIGLLNHLAGSKGTAPPIQQVTGEVPDISPYMTFHLYQLVLYADEKGSSFPSQTKERLGWWFGPCPNIGDILTYSILDCETLKLVSRSRVRPATDKDFVNQRAFKQYLEAGRDSKIPIASPQILSTEDIANYVKLLNKDDASSYRPPTLSAEELVGLSFLKTQEDGSVIRAKVCKKIMDRDAQNHQKIKFLLSLGDGELDELISYNELSDLIETQREQELQDPNLQHWAFREITDHEGPLTKGHPKYNGSTYNIRVHWETGEHTWEPLAIIAKTDPVTCAQYAKDHKLLDTKGWRFLKRYIAKNKKWRTLVNALKKQLQGNTPRYMFGVRIPKNHKEAEKLDRDNGNTLWADAIKKELQCLFDYKTFKDIGHADVTSVPEGFTRIRCHGIYSVKHDLRHKYRFVAGGDMTDPTSDQTYSSVVTLRGLRLAIFLAELNNMKVYGADISSAYLEAFTSEKVCFVAPPEFGELGGHLLVIVKALYGLRTSGARFRARLAKSLRSLGFHPCKNEPDIWMRDRGDHYEYICTWVDDLAICSREPEGIVAELSDPNGEHQYKFGNSVGPITYHLGGNFKRDPDGTLVYSGETYVKRMVESYERLYQESPKLSNCPLPPDDHPELDLSPELDADGIAQFQSLIGQLQWAISLCRFDINVHTMTLSRFRPAPRFGHLSRAKKIVGYLRKNADGGIRFRTGIPDYSGLEPPDYHWMDSVYGTPEEYIDPDFPKPLGKPVRTSTFKDANLMHDLVTGRSAMGIIHFVNQTPIDWFSKRQPTVETATYGSEFVAAKTATEQILDLRITLRSLGVPLDGPSWLFGDNKSVVTSGTIPHSTLSKRHNALAYHRVRETCASKSNGKNVMNFIHISTKQNASDVLTKFLPYTVWHPLVDPLLFRAGETMTKEEIQRYDERERECSVKNIELHNYTSDPTDTTWLSVMEELNLSARD